MLRVRNLKLIAFSEENVNGFQDKCSCHWLKQQGQNFDINMIMNRFM